MAQGYYHHTYADSLTDFGTVLSLESAKAWALQREIPNSKYKDAMGCYPLLCCQNWPGLAEDFIQLKQTLVSFSCVTDPFGNYSALTLDSIFDTTVRFKDHFITDLSLPQHQRINKHHARELMRSQKHVQVDQSTLNPDTLDQWCELYEQLVYRHSIRGIAAFSRSSFKKLIEVPGLVVFSAVCDGKIDGISLWLVSDNVCYHHLGAYSENGYRTAASYALMAHALNHFSETGVRWANLGAGAGLTQATKDGLSMFKTGWSTGTRSSFLCGKIFNPSIYNLLTNSANKADSSYFPAYREGEF